ncbi:MAG: hypothetical protein KJS98_04540 [Nitrospirae bacterium]|nr:hypothetical protein [Nitrospirota bacterium]MDE3052178.1 hypothetical protein [Nitrospirota bacterium]
MVATDSTAGRDRHPFNPILLIGACTWLVLAAMLVPLPDPALSEAVPSTPPIQVRGEVQMLTSELVVVKSAEGTSILIPLGKDVPLDSSLKVGDRVEVVVTSGNHVTSVKKLTSDPLR